MDDQNKNLILATALSLVVILAWFWLFPPPANTAKPQDKGQITQTTQDQAKAPGVAAPAAQAPQTGAAPAPDKTVAAEIAKLPRIRIDTPTLEGSISTLGGRIDSLKLKDYRQTVAKNSPLVDLLKPAGAENPYYALYGWAPGGTLQSGDVPGPNTVWTAPKDAVLSPGHPVTMTWTNSKGLTFSRTLKIDDKYMFTVTQKVQKTRAAPRRLA
ncbi:MAG: membrane protein insertase YidC, partial [Allgaiera sp.]|nr:membrane protein insertase YidC [Allgaiera sp.]